jgi:hypothetical protein
VVEGGLPHYLLLICVKGEGTIAGESFRAGQCWLVPARSATFVVAGTGSEWLLTYTADQPADGLRMSVTGRVSGADRRPPGSLDSGLAPD